MKSSPITNHHLSFINSDGFTLIELLVVISILVMLMAILLPTVQRVRRQAKAVACQAKLRQFGLAFRMYTDDNGGRWFTEQRDGNGRQSIANWLGLAAPFWFNRPAFAACPLATKSGVRGYYDAFSSWWPTDGSQVVSTPSGEPIFGPVSYAFNQPVSSPPPDDPRQDISNRDIYWGTCDVRGSATIPLFFDSSNFWIYPGSSCGPPPFEAGPWNAWIYTWPMCINRHDSGVNMLFLDWSVRKVGLKELWTFKWRKDFNTTGPWTKRGGVAPEDWPEWMRRFKDY